MPDPSAFLDFQIDVAAWRRIRHLRARLKKAAQTTLDHLPKKFRFPFQATVLLTGNVHIRRLNRDFRGIDKPTNVLSFPQFTREKLPKSGKQQEPIILGDIALGYAYVAKESIKINKLVIDHITHLVVHGLLHLFGYDHIDDREAENMEKLEVTIMKALGLPDPYAVPSAGHKTKK